MRRRYPGVSCSIWPTGHFESYVTTQKGLLDLTIEQNTALGEATHDYSHDASEAKAEIANAIRQSVDHTEAAQRTVLDLAKEVIDTVKQQREVTHVR